MAERGIPISVEVKKGLQPKLGQAQKESFAFLEMINQDSSPVPPPEPSGHTDIRDNVYIPLIQDQMGYREISPEEAYKILRQEGNKILAKQE